MTELRFEWDEAKDRANQNKHGVSFAEAKTVFADDLGRLIPDPDHSEDGERFILIGMSKSFRLLIVCHCERGPDFGSNYLSP
jgi:hypothetical protein